MTEYEKIEKELTSLGWNCEQGKGDHMKFTKSGVPHIITVSRALGCSGRSYLNAVAEIRRWEPKSTLGKPVQSKDRLSSEDDSSQEENLTEEEKVFRQMFSYIAIDKKVRYVHPENRDYSKLKDSTSVMNVPYSVIQIIGREGYKKAVTSPDDKVTIRAQGNRVDVHTFSVSPDELDPWELQTCSACGAKAPQNAIRWKTSTTTVKGKTNEVVLCPDCAAKEQMLKELIDAFTKLCKRFAGIDDTILKSVQKEFSVLSENAKDDLVINCLDEETYNHLNEVLDKATKDLEKASFLKKIRPTKPVKQRKPNILDAFTAYKSTIAEELYTDKKSNLSDLTYQFAKLGDIPLITITMNSEDRDVNILVCLIKYLPLFLNKLEPVYPGLIPAARLKYPSISFDQYLTEKMSPEDVAMLSEVIHDEEFEDNCDMIQKLSRLPKDDADSHYADTLFDLIDGEQLIDLVKQEYSDDGKSSVKINTRRVYMPDRSLMLLSILNLNDDAVITEERKQKFLKAAGIVEKRIKNKTGLEIHAGFHLMKNGELECHIDDIEDNPFTRGFYDYDSFRLKKDKTFGPITLTYDEGENIEKMMSERDITFEEFFNKCVDAFVKVEYDLPQEQNINQIINPTTKPEITMTNNNENQQTGKELQDFETNELLKELKRRGVKMSGVQIPVVVMQDVNLDEI